MSIQTNLPRLPTIKHPANGHILTVHDLPPAIVRWTATQKAILATAIQEGLLTQEEACRRYEFTEPELQDIRAKFKTHGRSGLRTTRAQVYVVTDEARSIQTDFGEVIAVGDTVLNRAARMLSVANTRIYLTPREVCLLELLMANKGRVVGREEIMTHLYGDKKRSPETRVIEVWICKLRKKLEGGLSTIESVWGRGYRFVAGTKFS